MPDKRWKILVRWLKVSSTLKIQVHWQSCTQRCFSTIFGMIPQIQTDGEGEGRGYYVFLWWRQRKLADKQNGCQTLFHQLTLTNWIHGKQNPSIVQASCDSTQLHNLFPHPGLALTTRVPELAYIRIAWWTVLSQWKLLPTYAVNPPMFVKILLWPLPI